MEIISQETENMNSLTYFNIHLIRIDLIKIHKMSSKKLYRSTALQPHIFIYKYRLSDININL